MKTTFVKCSGLSAGIVLFVCLFPILALAQDDVWLGGTGNWSDPSKWSNGVPSGNVNVLIDDGNGTFSLVTLDTSSSIGNLIIDNDGDTLDMNGNSLTVNGGTVDAGGGSYVGTGLLDSGTLSIAGDTNLSGIVTMKNGVITSPGGVQTLTNQGSIDGPGNISAGNATLNLVNQGSIKAGNFYTGGRSRWPPAR